MLRIKRVREADLPFLVKLYLKSYKGLEEYSEKDEDGAYHYLLWLYNNCPKTFFKAEADSKIIGFIAFDPFWNRHKKRNLEIHEVVVDPDYRKKGIGSKMIDLAIKIGKRKKDTEASLWVGKKNVNAIKWYKKLGFVKVGEWGKWFRFKKKI